MQFVSLTKLKFNLFLDHLNKFLESTLEENLDVVKITETLINDYFLGVAFANYTFLAQIFLACNGTNSTELKHALLNYDIPTLREKLNTYHKNMAEKKLINANSAILSESYDNDDFESCIDAEEEGEEIDEFWDAESGQKQQDNETVLFDPSVTSIKSNENQAAPKQNFIQLLLRWFRKWIQHLRNAWLGNPLINDISIDKNSSNSDQNTSVQDTLTIESNTILATKSHLNEAHLTSMGSNPNAFYHQVSKTKGSSFAQAVRYEI